jgi:hypothetical protein
VAYLTNSVGEIDIGVKEQISLGRRVVPNSQLAGDLEVGANGEVLSDKERSVAQRLSI